MNKSIYFNPLDTACKNVTGALKEGDTLKLTLFYLKETAIHPSVTASDHICVENFQTPNKNDCIPPEGQAYLHLNRDGEEASSFVMQATEYGWTISLRIHETGLYFYTFYIENIGFISCGNMQMGYVSNYPKGFMLTVHCADYQTPAWFKGGVLYQIFPDRFCKAGTMPDIDGRISRKDWGGLPNYRPNENGKVLNNDFFGGNFKGIASKLPYLKDLGVTMIYLNPIFEAASNHRYDTSDYMQLDPMLGTEKDFQELIDSANKYGIRLILDGVFNHTGDDSVYFNKYGHYPSIGAYQSKDSPYYSWYSFWEYPDKYESWWGIDILPQVNENSEDYQEFIFGKEGVLKKWLRFGIGGYRLDVADELPDFFLKKLRKAVKDSNQDAIIIGEVWEDAADKIAYSKRREYLQGHELDSVMNYPWKDAIIAYIQSGDTMRLLATIRALIDHYPKATLDCLMNILGTHDTARILTVLGGIYCANKDEMAGKGAYLDENSKKKAIEKLKMAVILQYTLPGVPCVYYGDENGAEGHIDPFCRQCFDWENLNEELISFYKKIGDIRKQYRNIFKDGEFKEIFIQEGLIIYKRTKEEKNIYVYTNNSSKNYLFDLPNKMYDAINDRSIENELEIKQYSYGILAEIK